MFENSFKLFKYQKDIVENQKSNRAHALLLDTGCLSGDTIIKVNKGGCSRQYTIKQLYERFESWCPKTKCRIRSFKGNLIRLNDMIRVYYSGKKELYKLVLEDGKCLKATYEHRILTKDGWKNLIDLNSSDLVMVDNISKQLCKNNNKVKTQKHKYKTKVVGKYYLNARKHRVNSKYPTQYVTYLHRIVYDAYLNKMNIDDFIKETHINPNLKYVDIKTHHVHHINSNTLDNRLENLKMLKIKEHQKIHAGYHKFKHGVPEYSTVKSIEKLGVRDTYDIEMKQPYDNYVANGIVVHNTGKTIISIDLLLREYEKQGGVTNTLIVGPISVLKQWEEALLKANDDLFWNKICILRDDRKKTLADFKKKPICIVNYEKLVSKKYYELISNKEWDVIVLDESHKIKNPKAKSTKNILKIANNKQKKLILTGTPNPNSMLDLWSQYKFLNGVLGNNYFAFKNMYFIDHNLQKKHFLPRYFPDWRLAPGSESKILSKIKPYTSVARKQDCLDLPPLVNIHRYTQLSPEQSKHYKNLFKDFISYIDDIEACVAKTAMTKLIRLAQVVMGFIVSEDGNITKLKNNRITVLQDILESIPIDKQTIVWTNYRETYKDIEKLLQSMDISYNSFVGGLSPNERDKVLHEFKTGKKRVLIANPASAGTGLNLQCASYMIYYQNTFNYMLDEQSQARCYRSGSEIHDKITRIDILCEETIDIEIKKALGKKKEVLDYILEGVKK